MKEKNVNESQLKCEVFSDGKKCCGENNCNQQNTTRKQIEIMIQEICEDSKNYTGDNISYHS